ncbi:MAG: BtrH N-terminal domain-containing protein [bacterium]|nr:BtrH N-terminal domain-containing protein [bacterium]
MTPALPERPHLGHLEKSAEQLLAAHRRGDVRCCEFLRGLRRFAAATDAAILSAELTLMDTKQVVAVHYGCASWGDLRDQIGTGQVTTEHSLAAVTVEHEIPEYAGAGVPLAIVAALRDAGVDIGFAEFAAASGWAFSFGYRYEDVSPAHMAVRGDPERDGPWEVFAFLPRKLGFEYEMAPTADATALWDFVRTHVDAGTPIMSEHLDGGLITGYQELHGKRLLYFDGTVGSGWLEAGGLQPHAAYVFGNRRSTPAENITRLALERALAKSVAHEYDGTPQGLAALRAYLGDVVDPSKDFAATEEWFCWAAFERLLARRCCELWLGTVADRLDGDAREPTLRAAEHYGRAAACYDAYRAEVAGGAARQGGLCERARTPDRIAVIAPLLEQGIDAEAAGVDALERAVGALR